MMNIWANGEPEIIQYGTSVLGESFPTKIKCEERLRLLSKDQNLTEDFGINGILRNKLVYRSFDQEKRINLEYSCLEVNFKF